MILGVVTDPRGRPLFPLDLGAYRGEPLGLLAGNPLGRQAASVDCRVALDMAEAARRSRT